MKHFLKASLTVAMFALIVGFAGVQSAKADPVTFSTTGVFSASGSNTAVFGAGANTLTLMFVGTPPGTTVDIAPGGFTNASFGDITATATGDGASPTGTFTLTFTQTAPSGGNDSISGSLSGTIDFDTSTAFLFFTDTQASIGTVTYTVLQTAFGYALVPPSTGGMGGATAGNTTLQGRIDLAQAPRGEIPEPATMILLGTGLVGVAAKVRQRRKAS